MYGILARVGILLLGSVLDACFGGSDRQGESCWVDTPEGKKPCDKNVNGAENFPDSDNDRVPDNVDLCPNEPHIGSPDGCAPKCSTDKDGDGLNDCEDQCPDVPGLSEIAGCTEMTNVLALDLFRLRVQRQDTFIINSAPLCVHADYSYSQAPSIFWTDGERLLSGSVPFTEDAVVRQKINSPIDLCHVRRAIQRDALGNINVTWIEGNAGEMAYVYFQRYSANGTPLCEPLELDSFPKPNTGAQDDASIAALAVKGDGTAIVVWVNRDKVLMKEIPLTGETSESRLANVRVPSVERNMSPDVAIDDSGAVAVVWQEGRQSTGPIRRAIFEDAGAELFRETIAQNGRLPRVSFAGGVAAYSWENGGIYFTAERKSGTNYERIWLEDRPLFLTNAPLYAGAEFLLDSKKRFVAGFTAPGPDANAYSVWFKSAGHFGLASTGSLSAPVLLDSPVRGSWLSVAGNQTQESVSILYLGNNPNSYQLNQYTWEGSDSMQDGAAIMVSPNPVALGAKNIVPFKMQNFGIENLEASWIVDGDCKVILQDGSESDSGVDVIAPASEKNRTLSCSSGAVSGNLRIRSNDYRQSEIVVPVRR